MTEPLAPAQVKSLDYLYSAEEIKHAEVALEKALTDLKEMWQKSTITTTLIVDEVIIAINRYLELVRPTDDAWYIPCPANFPIPVAKMITTRFRSVHWQAEYLPHLTNIPVFYLELC